MSEIYLFEGKAPWLPEMHVPFANPDAREYLKQFPGVHWIRENKRWAVPVELLPMLNLEYKECRDEPDALFDDDGIDIVFEGETATGRPTNILRSYQVEAVKKALVEKRALFGFDTGLGKSAAAILASRYTGSGRILVITPALVRRNWVREFDRWWTNHPEVGVIEQGRGRKAITQENLAAYEAPVQIVSYALLNQIEPKGWDMIIFDEVHMIKNPAAKVSKVAEELVRLNPEAHVLGLTATAIPNVPADIFGVLNVIWPRRFGKLQKNRRASFDFNCRYSDSTTNEYGTKWHGLNPLHTDEFRARVDAVMVRATKQQYAKALPPFFIDNRYIQKGSGGVEGEKVGYAIKWAKEESQVTSHVCVLTHTKDAARRVSEALPGSVLVTGDLPPKERDKTLQEACAAPQSILVATMHSIGIGIDLTRFTQVLFAQMYARPATLVQAAGRFSRLSSKKASYVWFLVVENTNDEILAHAVRDKMMAAGKVLKAGATEEQIQKAFTVDHNEEWLEKLRAKVTITESDPYEEF